ncbi:hypothetical protein [Paraburkholderia antibiotica]|uniref:Transmembrane protein n=1 Tax=Paraburkholderia antibiotica TaxID=2728839 RepID=A0A7Y0A260_9BURK|nr:hypothetical protein [Paraburkholderia antibiotica]NML35093.1 hypothetical protein [Paraburkholderia antibiotica]
MTGVIACQSAFADNAPASQPAESPSVMMSSGTSATIMIAAALVLLISWMTVISALRKQNWNLGLALSEEAELPAGTPPPAAGQLPPMAPSASRLIALMGLIVFSTFFIGIGFYVIWALCNGRPLDGANDAWKFFAAGSAMFLPYGANKFADAFK